jgi:hypothetical protein
MTDPGVVPSPSGAGADGPRALGKSEHTVEKPLMHTHFRADGWLCLACEAELREGIPHPWYGPCDAFGPHGFCSECRRITVFYLDEDVRVRALLAEQRELIGRLTHEANARNVEIADRVSDVLRLRAEVARLTDRLAGLDGLMVILDRVQRERDEARGAADRMREKAEAYDRINSPELYDFVSAVTNEALHQREKWGIDADGGKSDADWFWLIGYLAGKALHNPEKSDMPPTDARLHRIITVAAAAANWHAATLGTYARMRPGIESPDGASRSAGAGTTGEG